MPATAHRVLRKDGIMKTRAGLNDLLWMAISLNQKRKVMLMCQDAPAALEQAIQQEPIARAPVSLR